MAFLMDVQEVKSGLIVFRRTDVQHSNWYCRLKVPKEDRYKTVSLKTPDLNEARDRALEYDADMRFRLKHGVPIFEKSFAQVAEEYSKLKKQEAEAGQITPGRWAVLDSNIRLHLIPYVGNLQITHIGEDKWRTYPIWRKQKGNSPRGRRPKLKKNLPVKEEGTNDGDDLGPPKDGSIRQEMMTFRAIMNYAVSKQYIREGQAPKGKLIVDKARREEFTPKEYRQLHTYGRTWVKAAANKQSAWYRAMAYNFMLVMANTGMRTMEAKNLRWRDIDVRKDKEGRKFVTINVRGKGKYRELVAAPNVDTYLDRIRELSKATNPDDHVFTNHDGKRALYLYKSLMEDLLEKSGLLMSSSGSRRSTYCFRHTYATFRLMEGVDVYFLAKQMGTSVKMIEDYYGHITPAKNAERILQGIPGWEPIDQAPGGAVASVNAG